MSTVGINSKNFDYSECSFEVRLTKKKFLHSVLRYVYFGKDKLAVCKARHYLIILIQFIFLIKEPYQLRPDKVLALGNRITIKWLYDAKKIEKPFKEKAIGFCILSEKDEVITTFYGDQIIMTSLLEFLQKQIFQSDFLQEYEILQKIGKGKYAKVYKVKRKDTGQLFAVKYLHKRKMKDIDDSECALDNELDILRLMDHPNCLKLLGCYQDSVGYYILTELLDDSKSLQQEMTKYKNPQFSYKMVKHILSQLLKGLEYIHSKGIMHRDLKPQNIMFGLSSSGALSQLKLIDFGLAQFIEAEKYIYVHVGTPGYVAPEILANESDTNRYDEKCDLFSIGVIFHTLQLICWIKGKNNIFLLTRLTGKTVFPGNKFSQVLEKNKLCQIQLTGARYEQINGEALDLLEKLLEKDPKRRISAKDALRHIFFDEKGIDIDKMPSCIETGFQVQRLKLGEGIRELPKRPTKSQSFLQQGESNMYASPLILKGVSQRQTFLFNQPNNENEGGLTPLPTQVNVLYRFCQNLFNLLEDIKDNKQFLSNPQEDYSPLKLQIEQNQNLYFGQPSLDFDTPQLFSGNQKKSRENSIIHPIKVKDSIKEEDEENRVVNEPQQKEGKYNARKNLFVNTKGDRKNVLQEANQNDQEQQQQQQVYNLEKRGAGLAFFEKQRNEIEKKSPAKDEIEEAYSLSGSHLFKKIDGEISSPVSPPQKRSPNVDHNLKLRIEKADSTNLPNQNQLFDQEGHTIKTTTKYPKEIVQLIEFFPKDMFSCYLNHNQEEIEKGMSSRVYKLGLFLLFGKEVIKQPSTLEIQDRFKEISEKEAFHPWFISMLKGMLSEQQENRPTFKQLNEQMGKNFKKN